MMWSLARRWWAAAALALCFACGSAQAQEPPPPAAPAAQPSALALRDVVRAVVRQFPLMQAADKDRAVAQGELLAAQGGFDPVWRTRAGWMPAGYYRWQRFDTSISQPTALWGTSLFAGYRFGLGSFPVYDGKQATLGLGELRAGVNVPLLRDGPIDARRAALGSARLGPRIAEGNVAAQRIDLVRTATLRYWNWVESARAVQVARQLLRLAEERDVALAERVKRGDVADIERQENLRAIVARRAVVVQFERSLQGASFELEFYLQGTRASVPREPAPDFPEPGPATTRDLREETARALARRPELDRLAAQKQQLRYEVALADNQARPALDLQAVVSKDLGPGPANLRPAELEVGLLLDVPVLARVARGKARAATAKQEKIELQIAALKNRILADVRDSAAAETAARERLALARSELALARKLAQAERDAFDLGQSTLLLVNLREQAAGDAALREVVALADYHRAVAVYQAVTASQPDVPLGD